MKASFSTNTTGYLRKKINEYWRATNQWFLETPERSLERAYKAALTIRAIEDKHFGGNKISAELTLHSNNVMNYLQADLEKNLSIIKLRLTEFKVSRSFLSISNYVVLEKLRLIDEVIVKYTYKKSSSNALVLRAEQYKLTICNCCSGMGGEADLDAHLLLQGAIDLFPYP